MRIKQAAAKDIDDYIAGFPADVQAVLEKIRTTIRHTVPEAKEKISYQIPSFTLNGRYLVYFAGFKNHVSIYPAPTGDEELDRELSAYRSGKGTVKFRLDKPIPYELIPKIVKALAQKSLQRTRSRQTVG